MDVWGRGKFLDRYVLYVLYVLRGGLLRSIVSKPPCSTSFGTWSGLNTNVEMDVGMLFCHELLLIVGLLGSIISCLHAQLAKAP